MGNNEVLLLFLQVPTRGDTVMGKSVRIRELVGWTLDEDEYRPAIYDRSNHSCAQRAISRRAPFESSTVLLEDETAAIQDLLARHLSRPDLLAEMTGLTWSLGVIDLRGLIAFQRRIAFNFSRTPSPAPHVDDWPTLSAVSFGASKPPEYEMIRKPSTNRIIFRSCNPNLSLRFFDDPSSPFSVHAGSPFFEVAQYRDRWFLRDGYHRAYDLLRANVIRIPAVIVYARTLEELGATQPWFFNEETLLSNTPPRVIDFLDDALVLEYNRPLLIKTVSVTIEESLAPITH
jgi:hypothetical protein